jgi:hypothetical protein
MCVCVSFAIIIQPMSECFHIQDKCTVTEGHASSVKFPFQNQLQSVAKHTWTQNRNTYQHCDSMILESLILTVL